jgi:cobalt-zinc-cadmium efflux system membrane fusion protein
VSGPVTRILVDTGTMVKAGDPLLYVSSTDASNAITVYRKAKNDEDLARRVMERSKTLLDHGAIAEKDFEVTVSALNDAASDVQNGLQSLKIFGLSQQDIDDAQKPGTAVHPEIALRAPITGMVVQKTVSPGQLVQAGATACFSISDVSTVWILAHVFDHDLPSVTAGDPVEASNPSFPTTFHGVISYIDALVDPDTRTTQVRVVTRNPGLILKKDMYVNSVILTRTRKNVLSVPVSAVLRDSQNEPIVYVEAEPGKFGQRVVTLGVQQNDRVEILSGLKEGENVVSEGSVFLQFASSYQ